MAQWPVFAYASAEWNNLTQEVRDAYAALAYGSGLSARDLQMRGYLKGLYRYSTP